MAVHITEATWFDATKALPSSSRRVAVLYWKASDQTDHISEARFLNSAFYWDVDSKLFDPSLDKIVQWAEIDPDHGGFKPDPFPDEKVRYQFLSNKL